MHERTGKLKKKAKNLYRNERERERMNAVQPQENWKTDSNYNINNTQGTDQVKYTTFITHNHGYTQVCNNCKREQQSTRGAKSR